MNVSTSASVTVFLCGHGSSDQRSQRAFASLVERFRRYSHFRIVSGTLEYAERLLDEQIAIEAVPGERFVLLPLFLAPGMHVEEDLGEALERARRSHPQVRFLRTPSLGEHEWMETLLSERARQWPGKIDEHTAVVILAHGSRREEANRLVQDMADGVWENLGGPLVTAAFWKVQPDLRSTLRELSHSSIRRVLLLPYFLFEGSLTDRVAWEVERLAGEFTKLDLQLDTVLGPDNRLLPLMQDLVESSLASVLAPV
ncbi:sirohydrochlorin chelatase [Gloeobacter kilaueensis]|nr:sirohydrochlorin chelatase [Gloeobacter kilaueensis]